MYKATQQQGAKGPENTAGTEEKKSGDQEVTDVDFEEVKDDKK